MPDQESPSHSSPVLETERPGPRESRLGFVRLKLDLTRWVFELAVVFVGILMALGVDDLVQMRRDRALEQYYIEGIAQDLDREYVDLRSAIRLDRRKITAAYHLLNLVGARLTPVDSLLPDERAADSMNISEAVAVLATYQEFTSADATYSEMAAASGVNKIRDLRLRRAITNHYWRSRQWAVVDQRPSVRDAPVTFDNLLRSVNIHPNDLIASADRNVLIPLGPAFIQAIRRVRDQSRVQLRAHAEICESIHAVYAPLAKAYANLSFRPSSDCA